MTLRYITNSKIGRNGLRKPYLVLIALIIALMLVNMGPSTLAGSGTEARTGDTGNEPTGGFTEEFSIMRVHHSNGDANTHFQADETIFVNASTNIFPNKPTHSKILIYTYNGSNYWETQTAKNFKQVSISGDNRTYQGTIDTSTLTPALWDDHFLLVAELKTSGAGAKTLRFHDTIKYGTGGSVQKSITLFHDSALTMTGYKVGVDEKIYIKVYTPSAPDLQNSKIRLLNYFDGIIEKSLDGLENKVIIRQGDYSIIEVDMTKDLKFSDLPGGYKLGDWYTLQVDLVDSIGTPMAKDWSMQIMAVPMPVITSTYADPDTVEMTGSDITNITVDFTDTDATSTGEFKITIRVRDEAKNIYSLCEGITTSDPNLVITDLGSGNYQAIYTWDPPATMLKGKYDLYSQIIDGNGIMVVDTFDNNKEDLTLTTTSVLPSISFSAVYCYPTAVDAAESDMTTVTANFTDPAETDKQVLEVTFSVRSPSNNETTLVDGKGHGGGGAFGGNLEIKENKGFYTASYDWDPPADIETGYYDLFVKVRNPHGFASDSFENNTDEVQIVYLGLPPETDGSQISADPVVVDKIGTGITTFSAKFADMDANPVEDFTLSLSVRGPDDNIIELLEDAKHNDAGLLGGVVTVIEETGTFPQIYKMTLTWDPHEAVPVGFYDIHFEVVDKYDKKDDSDYADNPDELEIIASVPEPKLTAGTTGADPAQVNRIGNGMTTIFAEFEDTYYVNATDFNVSFRVRDPDNNIINLVDGMAHGGAGEAGGTVRVLKTGANFTAEYDWDPPGDAVIGFYDLFFRVGNPASAVVEDGFGRNTDELEIITTPTPPVIEMSNITCDPSILEITEEKSTVFTAQFTDADNSPVSVFKVTFKVRSETGTELVLAERLNAGDHSALAGVVTIVNGTANGTYTATLEWDPNNDTEPGFYDLYFSVQDDTLALIKDDYLNNINELNLTHKGSGDNVTPPEDKLDLTDIEITHEDEHWYNFTVNYTNSDDLPPDENGVIIIIDGEEYKMLEVDGNDTDYTDGKDYYFRKELGDEDIDYSLKVNDTSGNGTSVPETSFTPETEEPHEEEHGEEDTRWQVLLAIILLIIVLILVLIFTRKKKPEEAEEGAEAEEEPSEEEEAEEEEGEGEDEESEGETVQTKLPEEESEAPTEEPAEPAEEGESTPEAKPADDKE